MRRSAIAVLVAAVHVGALLPSTAFAADGNDAIVLKDGNVLRGSLTEIAPGDHVTIVLSTGQTAVVKWDYVGRIDRNGISSSPGASTKPATPPPAPAPVVVAPPPAAAPMGKVHVHIDTEDPDVVLEMQQTNSQYLPVCQAPCDLELPLEPSYRIGGSGVRTSKPFHLSGAAGGKVVLETNPGSKGGFVGGIVLVSIGAPVIVIGAMVLLVVALVNAADINHTSNTGGAEIVGWTMAGAGAASIVGGVILLTSNSSTNVHQQAAWSNRTRRPTWASHELSVPPTGVGVTLPVMRF